jgi:hypothetical protein
LIIDSLSEREREREKFGYRFSINDDCNLFLFFILLFLDKAIHICILVGDMSHDLSISHIFRTRNDDADLDGTIGTGLLEKNCIVEDVTVHMQSY